jgi:hypothetical protein
VNTQYRRTPHDLEFSYGKTLLTRGKAQKNHSRHSSLSPSIKQPCHATTLPQQNQEQNSGPVEKIDEKINFFLAGQITGNAFFESARRSTLSVRSPYHRTAPQYGYFL